MVSRFFKISYDQWFNMLIRSYKVRAIGVNDWLFWESLKFVSVSPIFSCNGVRKRCTKTVQLPQSSSLVNAVVLFWLTYLFFPLHTVYDPKQTFPVESREYNHVVSAL